MALRPLLHGRVVYQIFFLCPSQLAVKLVRARMAELDTALAEAKAAGADVAVAAAEKEISGLEDSLDGEHGTVPRHLGGF